MFKRSTSFWINGGETCFHFGQRILLGSVQKIAQKSPSKKLHLPRVSKTFNSILPSFQFEILATIGNIGFLRSEMHVVYHINWKLRSKLRSGHEVSVAALVNPDIN